VSDLLEEVTELPEEEAVFTSSGVAFEVKSDDGHPILKAIGVFVIVICCFGIANGIDFISTDSGLIRPHEMINNQAKGAPYDSAVLTGTVYSEGDPIPNATITLEIKLENGLLSQISTLSDSEGEFRLENATPGLAPIAITRWNENGEHDIVQHRIILNPPTLLEPSGYTNMDFELPPESMFGDIECISLGNGSCLREINYHPQEMDFPLLDPTAGGLFVMVGWGFIGASIISCLLAVIGIKNGSRATIQMSAGLSFFTMGHFYSACIFGFIAYALTFFVPRKSIILDT
jgi:hypothetical protein